MTQFRKSLIISSTGPSNGSNDTNFVSHWQSLRSPILKIPTRLFIGTLTPNQTLSGKTHSIAFSGHFVNIIKVCCGHLFIISNILCIQSINICL